jgi:hypothetical protein
MPIEWGIIFLGTIAASAYFSFKAGYKSGAEFGVETVLETLAENGVIELEEVDQENQ